MKSAVQFFLNGVKKTVSDSWAFKPLADYLRYSEQLTGTKIVCAEGDCGACSVLLESLDYQPINSCIVPVYSLHGEHVVTVEGVGAQGLHPVQENMIQENGAQCGYCTPGFICAMAGYYEARLKSGQKATRKSAQNALTGNLCRCTGYDSILRAAETLAPSPQYSLQALYASRQRQDEMQQLKKQSVLVTTADLQVFLPTTLKEALEWRVQNPLGRIVSGATDLGVLVNKGKLAAKAWMSLQLISELQEVSVEKNQWRIGAQVSLTQLEAVPDLPKEFINLLHIFASPQIKNRATLVGNLVNASPIGDTIPAMMAMGAEVELQSLQRGVRRVSLENFYLGYKQLDLQADELVKAVWLPQSQWPMMRLYKMSLRRDLDISAVTFAGVLSVEKGEILDAKIYFGGVGPTVVRVRPIEDHLRGQKFSEKVFKESSTLLSQILKPLSDVRGSEQFRLKLCEQSLNRFYFDLHSSVSREVQP